jgi:hypothetical protein
MTDEEPVRKFARVIGVGVVYGPYTFEGRDGFKRRPFWYWMAEGDDAWIVADRLWPWLCQRRIDQIEAVFEDEISP